MVCQEATLAITMRKGFLFLSASSTLPHAPCNASSEPSNVRYQHHDYRERCADLTFGAASSLGQPHTHNHSRSARERRCHNPLRDPPSFPGSGTGTSAPFILNVQPVLPPNRPASVQPTIEAPRTHQPRQLHPSISHLQRRTHLAAKPPLQHLQANMQAPTPGDPPQRLHARLLLPAPAPASLRRAFRAAKRGIQNAHRPLPQHAETTWQTSAQST
jgi:hypothetical protein